MPARDSVVAELAATTGLSGATDVSAFRRREGDTTLRLVSVFTPAGTDLAGRLELGRHRRLQRRTPILILHRTPIQGDAERVRESNA